MSIRNVAIIGAGTIGLQISQYLAHHNINVYLRSRRGDIAIYPLITKLNYLVSSNKLSGMDALAILGRIHITDDLQKAVEYADLVVDCIEENLSAKLRLFTKLNHICKPTTIIASNTSSLDLRVLALPLTKRHHTFLGIHFFNPVHAMKLVEVNYPCLTNKDTVHSAMDFLTSIGKEPKIVLGSRGNIVNRLLIPLINEATYIVQNTPNKLHDVDECMKLGANHPIGPLELADLIGIDVVVEILRNLGETPSPLLLSMLENNTLGRKSGVGFYYYGGKPAS